MVLEQSTIEVITSHSEITNEEIKSDKSRRYDNSLKDMITSMESHITSIGLTIFEVQGEAKDMTASVEEPRFGVEELHQDRLAP